MATTTEQHILSQLDQIRRILVIMATSGMKQREQIALLSRAGLQPKDIADLVGTSSNTVRVELVALRRNKGVKSIKNKRG